MEELKKILVAVDFSDYSLPTLRYGLTLALDTGAEVAVVNVINERDVAAIRSVEPLSDRISADEYVRVQRESRLKKIDDLVDETGCTGVPLSKMIRVGVPAAELLAAIPEIGVDLVVIGTKGRTNLINTLFGSVAEKVHRRSPVSVLSVRGKEHADLVGRTAG